MMVRRLAVFATLSLAACSAQTTSTPATTASATSSAPAPTNTVDSAATPRNGTTPTSVAQDTSPYTLSVRGIGPHEFGVPAAGVIAALDDMLGDALKDDVFAYAPTGDGGFYSADVGLTFSYPVSRGICWPNDLCVYFGGETADDLTLVGYEQSETTDAFVMANGLAAGMPATGQAAQLTVNPSWCGELGDGQSDGVRVGLRSKTGSFNGGTTPELSDLTITYLAAGDTPAADEPCLTAPSTTVAAGDTTAGSAPAATTTPTTASNATETVAKALTVGDERVGDYPFGTATGPVVTGITALVGSSPVSDNTMLYPDGDEYEGYANNELEAGFSAPVSREVCWSNELCVIFAGETPGALNLAGYRISTATDHPVRTDTGIAVGDNGADHRNTMTIFEGGCTVIGSGDSAGVTISLESTGVLFTDYVNDTWVNNTPDHADVKVIAISDGAQLYGLYDDC